jgi:hypothetical protein
MRLGGQLDSAGVVWSNHIVPPPQTQLIMDDVALPPAAPMRLHMISRPIDPISIALWIKLASGARVTVAEDSAEVVARLMAAAK